jgi:predicted esterase
MPTFSEVVTEFFELYGKQAYADALALVEASMPAFPERRTELTTWRMCMQSRLGRTEDAVQTLSKAIETSTYWWRSEALHKDPYLATLQDIPEYQYLVAICETRQAKALKHSRPERLVFAPKKAGTKKLPLLITFHGWGANAELEAPHWQGLADQGWLVAVTRSSQQIADGLYVWDDLKRTQREAKAHYKALCRDFPVDPERVVLAGFSQGGGRALWLALTRAIPARGFIGLGPYLDEIDTLAPTLPPQVASLRAYLIAGAEEQDEGMFAKIEALCASRDVPFCQETLPAIGHEYPPDFAPILRRALTFVFESQEEHGKRF